MGIKWTFEVDQSTKDNYQALAQSAPRTLQTFVGGTMRQHMEDEVAANLAITPPSAKQPIDWTSQKQRNYYFGFIAQRDGNGNILPYVRTGGFNESWFVRVDLSDLTVGIGNSTMTKGSPNWEPQPLYNFLVGGQQQRFHANTGWIQADDPLLQIVIGTFDILADCVAGYNRDGRNSIMSMDRDINANLNIEVDPQLQQKLSGLTRSVNAELNKVGKNPALDEMAKDASKVKKELKETAGAAKEVATQTSKITTGGGGVPSLPTGRRRRGCCWRRA